MFRVHRDFNGLLKAAQDEYDSLVELNESLRKLPNGIRTKRFERQLSWLSIIAPTPYARCQITKRKQKKLSKIATTSHARTVVSIYTS